MGFVKRIIGGGIAGATLLSFGIVAAPSALAAQTTQPEPTPYASTGTSYYVDCSATTDGNGTIESPYNSLASANRKAKELKAGESLLFKRGSVCKSVGEGANKVGLQVFNAVGTPDKVITIGAYGPQVGAKPVLEGDGVRDTVYVENSQYIEIRDLKVTNKDANESEQWTKTRRGIIVANMNAGELKHTVIENNEIDDVTGKGVKDLGGSGAIQMEVYGSSRMEYSNGDWNLVAHPELDKDNVPSYFNGTLIANNNINNVARSGINMSTDFKCREESGWDGGGVCDPGRREYNPWTPSLNLIIRDNHVEHVGGDGIVVQMNDGAIVEGNYLNDAANKHMQFNAGIWNWNTDNTLFQYNEVTNTQKYSENTDGNAWDVDYGTRGTIFQYNYSHDNAGGTVLYCGCGDWRVAGSGHATGSVFRYNISVNDGLAKESHTGNVQTQRFVTLQGVTDGQFYNNLIVMPNGKKAQAETGNAWWLPTTEGSAYYNSGLSFANNLFIADGDNWLAGEPKTHLTWNNNVFVGGANPDKWQSKLLGEPSSKNNQYVTLDDFFKDSGTSIEKLRNAGSDLSVLDFTTKYTAGKGVAVAEEGTKDFFGRDVPTYGSPDVGASQKSAVAASATKQQTATIAAGKSAEFVAPQNKTIKVSAKVAAGTQLKIESAGNAFVRKTGYADKAGVATAYVRTSTNASKLTVTYEAKDDAAAAAAGTADVTVNTVTDYLYDGSFESIGGTPWTVGGTVDGQTVDWDTFANDATGNALRALETRSEKNQKGVVGSGEFSGRFGTAEVNGKTANIDTINQRNIQVVPGATYTLGFWAIPGATADAKATPAVTATVKSRKASSGTGSVWAQYATELATASTSADAKAGEPQYVTTTFTVPADAATEGALWLSFSDKGLAADANGYIDDVVLVRSDVKPTLKLTDFTTTVSQGETASAYVELDAQPNVSVVWQKQVDGKWTNVTTKTGTAAGNGVAENTRWLSLPNATAADAGQYRAVVTNSLGESVTSDPVTVTVTEKPAEATVAAIFVSALPTTTSYPQGSAFDASGLKVGARLTDGTSIVLDPSTYEVSGFDSSKVGRIPVRVTLKSDKTKTTSFPVDVTFVKTDLAAKYCSAAQASKYQSAQNYGPFPATLTCDGSLTTAWANWNEKDTDPWLSYTFDAAHKLGDLELYVDPSKPGEAPAKFDVLTLGEDGSTWNATKISADVTATNPNTVDLSSLGAVKGIKLKLTYKDGLDYARVAEVKIYEAADAVQSAAPTADKLTVTGPTKTAYTIGEKFDAAGLVAKATLNDADKTEKTLAEGDYTLTATDAEGKLVDLSQPFAKVGDVTVTLTALTVAPTTGDTAATATFTLKVNEVDKTALNKAIAAAEKVQNTGYTEDSWTSFQFVLATVKTVAANPNATAAEVAAATKALIAAQNALVVEQKVTGIKIEAEPAKTTYTVGDTFSAKGLVVSKTQNVGGPVVADASEYQLTAADAAGKAVDLTKPFAAVGKVTVTVTLTGTEFAKSFDVTVNEADKAALNEAIAAAEKLTADKYESGWDAFQTALAAAKTVAADKNATPAAVADALAKLTDAQNALVPVKPATVTGIEVTEPKTVKYTVGDTFSADGLVVKKVMSKGDPAVAEAGEYTVTAADASGAAVDLAKPFAAVGKVTVTVALKGADFAKTFEVTVAAVDKTALKAAVDAAEKLDEADYESGWADFRNALSDAEAVLADENATPDAVSGALEALTAAQKALVKKAPAPKPEPEQPTKPEPNKPGTLPGDAGQNGDKNGADKAAGDKGGLSKTGASVAGVAVAAVLLLAAGVAVMLRRRA
ncbi:bacterial Ig-like domain-containing protein [Bifidobacterium leontopitheci]|uniref:Bacterial Ig-like domain (Group 3) n=1 Tax=Bifidobacterium leontopitheci TaxID=2650774 RepID=A0A6I1GL97_9BIFI|nr:bacterial Ig-like domain-containing protein [Bifidobacterium leontopitheci]KAB7790376.1 Bacterial Ig-like domain (group 3) [Bifidobacterium leontopitheci]